MRFFWKMSLVVVAATVITFSAGSYLLIESSFDSLMEEKVNQAFQENLNIQEKIGQLVIDFPHNGQISAKDLGNLVSDIHADGTVPFRIGRLGEGLIGPEEGDEGLDSEEDWLAAMPGQAVQSTGEQAVAGRRVSLGPKKEAYQKIENSGGSAAYSYKESEDVREDKRTLRSTVEKKRIPGLASAHKVVMQAGQYQIKTLKPLKIEDSIYYVETTKDVTDIFKFREGQFRLFRQILTGLVLLIAVAVMMISYWLTYPLKRLSKAVREIASGDLSARPAIQSQDEVGELAADFNHMADRLETQIHQLNETMIRQKEFMASFAHETKTPLTSIIGYADMLRSKKMTEERTYEAADTIVQEGKRLEALGSKLMEIVVLGKTEICLQPVSVNVLMESVKRTVLPGLNHSHISLSIQVEESKIAADYDLIKTVLLNLMDNSRKAMEGGGKIFITGVRQKGTYCICVRDTGTGIPAGELERITEAFYMVDKSRSRAQGGAGLGLALCETIMRLHRGKMRIVSEVKIGTSVILELKEAENETV